MRLRDGADLASARIIAIHEGEIYHVRPKLGGFHSWRRKDLLKVSR